MTAAEAVKVIKSGDHVHISSVSNVPQCLVKALCDRGRESHLHSPQVLRCHPVGHCGEHVCEQYFGHYCVRSEINPIFVFSLQNK